LVERIAGEARRKGAHLITTLCPLCQLNLDAGQEKSKQPPLPIPYFTQLAGLALGIPVHELGMEKLLVPMDEILKKVQ
jgi:heterodisulfide reductase subunit B